MWTNLFKMTRLFYKDTSECACRDLLSSKSPIDINKGKPNAGKITSCAKLAKDYPFLCKTYGGKEGLCCKACEKVGKVSQCLYVSISHLEKLCEY